MPRDEWLVGDLVASMRTWGALARPHFKNAFLRYRGTGVGDRYTPLLVGTKMNTDFNKTNNGGSGQEGFNQEASNKPQQTEAVTPQQEEATMPQTNTEERSAVEYVRTAETTPNNIDGEGPTKEHHKKLSGAGRKRFAHLLKKGLTREEAYAKALEPMPTKNTGRTTTGPKRLRSVEDTPPEATAKKRPKDDGPSTSRDAALRSKKWQPTATYKDITTGVKMAVLARDYPNTVLTTEQMDSIQQLLLDKILAGKNMATKPAFLGTTYKAGYLVLHCKESTSAEWVKAAISNASPWEGATLWATEESKIPHSRIAVGYFPNSLKVETARILDFVQGQNKGLNVYSWRLLKRAERGSNVTLVLAVDKKSAASLMEYNGRINYRFIQVTLRLKAEDITTEELVDQMEAVELEEEDESPPNDSENEPQK